MASGRVYPLSLPSRRRPGVFFPQLFKSCVKFGRKVLRNDYQTTTEGTAAQAAGKTREKKKVCLFLKRKKTMKMTEKNGYLSNAPLGKHCFSSASTKFRLKATTRINAGFAF